MRRGTFILNVMATRREICSIIMYHLNKYYVSMFIYRTIRLPSTLFHNNVSVNI